MGSVFSRARRGSRGALAARFARLRLALALSEPEFWGLFCAFCAANRSHTGLLTEAELGAFLGWHADPRPLERRAYLLMRDDARGVSFRSFAVQAWAICVCDPTALAHFAFQLYDVGGVGCLSLADVRLMFREAFGGGWEANAGASALFARLAEKDFCSNVVGATVPIARFLKLAASAATLLAPVFRLQRALQARLLGVDAWERITARRDALLVRGELHGEDQPGFDIVMAARAVDAALGRGRADLAAACAGGGAAAAAAAARPSPSAPLLLPPPPPPPRELHATQPTLNAGGVPLPRPVPRRVVVVPVTDRHFLPAAIALGPAAVRRGGAPGLTRGTARTRLQADHKGYDRPDSPGRDRTLAEEGAVIVGAALWRAVKRAGGAVARAVASWGRGRGSGGGGGAGGAQPRRQRLRDAEVQSPSWAGAGSGGAEGGRVAVGPEPPPTTAPGRGAFHRVR